MARAGYRGGRNRWRVGARAAGSELLAKKPAARKTVARKTAAKKPVARKAAAKRTTRKVIRKKK